MKKEESSLRIGNIGKAAELALKGLIEAKTPVYLTRAGLDEIARRNPNGYLREIEELCASMHNVIGVREDFGTVELLTVGLVDGRLSTFRLSVLPTGVVLKEARIRTDKVDDDFLVAKKIVRSKKYR